MTRTQTAAADHPQTLHTTLNPFHVQSLAAQLSSSTYMALLDGGCDMGLLGKGWRIMSYTG